MSLPQKKTTSSIGKEAENIAAEYLMWNGYQILFQAWRKGKGEIDIIALSSKNTLVFVEVKYRKNKGFGAPEEAVNENKRAMIRKTAELFLYEKPMFTQAIRFDIISILQQKGCLELFHCIDAF